MFTGGAFALVILIAWFTGRRNEEDRPGYDRARDRGDDLWQLTLHIRQDLKLVAFLLGGVIIMLGVVADRIH